MGHAGWLVLILQNLGMGGGTVAVQSTPGLTVRSPRRTLHAVSPARKVNGRSPRRTLHAVAPEGT